ncbi:bifunctional 2-polyprenyl-6-hydroxyphenol methylase/3-demethylubiquinol 3-O-methyltransferase UbiG [Oecophyllibacter saccharovorans]|uniref:bifunctional 2-polyprenyl-6-hydroxyphenol methylase/3-demethylubiquinol 3-O-methyltransferase UbiG n=1 Tax=Oecophyllibacter saccharovorans TaxID=2558360 RepID=UPI00116E3791|nr:bifunctional 2-polyprenyl-6-hydroxyphenol methylase/3-demethylubiquinol 3-O-methyltransferase UbiG [Oecophyllibacter saccharovorans]TPW35326.1 bifunctional 2-polyprenyl-6-hydroxyphenol methylase/3-demethylubiquinol 3-O-methyltransferase UbiG [Oecophyllibacter saccharovorans]
MDAPPDQAASSVVDEEIAHFNALAGEWWNPKGPMAPLHAMNPLRTDWVKQHAAPLPAGRTSTLLDIGCGAGLASERYARIGFETLGVDASPDGIAAARHHLATHPLPSGSAPLSYHNGNAEDLVKAGETFDVVSALEIIEHVRNPQAFLQLLATLTRPGGYVAVSTLNRTLRSFLVAKLGAEYVMRFLEPGTHDWKKFIRPQELDRMARRSGLRLKTLSGFSFHPPHWVESRDTSINYIAMFVRD